MRRQSGRAGGRRKVLPNSRKFGYDMCRTISAVVEGVDWDSGFVCSTFVSYISGFGEREEWRTNPGEGRSPITCDPFFRYDVS